MKTVEDVKILANEIFDEADKMASEFIDELGVDGAYKELLEVRDDLIKSGIKNKITDNNLKSAAIAYEEQKFLDEQHKSRSFVSVFISFGATLEVPKDWTNEEVMEFCKSATIVSPEFFVEMTGEEVDVKVADYDDVIVSISD